MIRHLITALRVIIPTVLLAWILTTIRDQNPDAVRDLIHRPKDWWQLALALLCYLAAIVITFGRWFLLVRALRLPFRLIDAIRLGFIGFFFQFFSLGTVGGDLFKAIFVAREQPNRRPEAVATIFIDRIVGFLGLLIVTSAAFWWLGRDRMTPELWASAMLCWLITAIGAAVVLAMIWTPFSLRPFAQLTRKIPAVPAILLRIQNGLEYYRADRASFVFALLTSLVSHTLLASSTYFASRAIFSPAPSFMEQMVIWQISGAFGALPISPGGLGTFEAAYSYLYQNVPVSITTNLDQGFIVAILSRVLSLAVAAIGVAVYWFSRREVRDLMDSAPPADGTAE